MLKIGNVIQLSASDLVGHLNCRNLTELDLAVAKGTLAKPRTWNPLLDVLRERGLRHEQGYVDHLSAKGLDVETVAGVGLDEVAVAATARAIEPWATGDRSGRVSDGKLGRPDRCSLAR